MALFDIRPARSDDLAYIDMICDESGLGHIESIGQLYVAVNEDDVPVGFIRIETMGGDDNYVYPVATFSSWQRHGVGSTLIEHARQHHGTLKLVACSESQGFYPKLGFEPIAMEDVATRIAGDCTVCSRRETCSPQAFILRGEAPTRMNGVCLPAQSEGGKAPHHASVYDDILKTARETWQNALGNCNGCGLCASRCELFGDGIASMSDIVGSGMVLLDAIEELFAESGFDDRTISDTIHTHTEKYDKLYSLTRRCCLCNNCTARCPGAVRADRVMRPWRALYQRSGLFGTVNNDLKSVEVDKEWHLFSVYRYLNGVFYPEFIHLDDAGPGQVDTLFFPGCTMVTYMDDSVRATGKLLDDRGYRWAIDLGCCGSPLVGRGLPERVETLQRKLLDRCHAAGIKRIITVCAGCEMELVEAVGKHGVGAPEVISLPQLLVDLGVDLPESPQDVAFFDSCHDRSQSHGSPLRRMFAGCSICKLEHEGQDTLCCGAGGAVSSFDAEIGGIRAGRILEEAVAAGAKILISSCPTCAYTFAFQKIYGNPPSESAGIECRHYLELLFGIETDWSQVFARAEWMWTGEHSAWVLSELT